MSYDIQFGQVLKEKRSKFNLTQAQLANRLGTTQERISRLESGLTKVSLEDAMRISNFFGESMEQFINIAFNQAQADDLSQFIPQVIDEIKYGHLDKAKQMMLPLLNIECDLQPAVNAFFSNALFWEGNFSEAVIYARKAKNLFPEPLHNDMTFHVAIMCEMLSLAKAGERDEALNIFNELEEHFESNSPMMVGVFLQTATWLFFNLWDKENALKYADRLLVFGTEHNQTAFEAMGLIWKGWAIGTAQDSVEGIRMLNKGWELLKSFKGFISHSIYSVCICDVYKHANAPKSMISQAQEAFKRMKKIKSFTYMKDIKQFLEA